MEQEKQLWSGSSEQDKVELIPRAATKSEQQKNEATLQKCIQRRVPLVQYGEGKTVSGKKKSAQAICNEVGKIYKATNVSFLQPIVPCLTWKNRNSCKN